MNRFGNMRYEQVYFSRSDEVGLVLFGAEGISMYIRNCDFSFPAIFPFPLEYWGFYRSIKCVNLLVLNNYLHRWEIVYGAIVQ